MSKSIITKGFGKSSSKVSISDIDWTKQVIKVDKFKVTKIVKAEFEQQRFRYEIGV